MKSGSIAHFSYLYPSYFKLHVRWLRLVTRITYLSKLIGTPSLAACLKLELFRVCIIISPIEPLVIMSPLVIATSFKRPRIILLPQKLQRRRTEYELSNLGTFP
ncbi:hypothetical protein CUU52_01220 [Pectobacterium polaris]|nr:hypothetical protein [Pectobacterium polaris]